MGSLQCAICGTTEGSLKHDKHMPNIAVCEQHLGSCVKCRTKWSEKNASLFCDACRKGARKQAQEEIPIIFAIEDTAEHSARALRSAITGRPYPRTIVGSLTDEGSGAMEQETD